MEHLPLESLGWAPGSPGLREGASWKPVGEALVTLRELTSAHTMLLIKLIFSPGCVWWWWGHSLCGVPLVGTSSQSGILGTISRSLSGSFKGHSQ